MRTISEHYNSVENELLTINKNIETISKEELLGIINRVIGKLEIWKKEL